MWFFKKQKISFPKRNFSPAYLLDNQLQQSLEREGYAIGRNLVTPEEIEELNSFFLDLQKIEGYDVNEIFESSGNFNSVELQQHIFAFVKSFLHRIADRFANLDNCSIGDGGAFFIKPNSPKSRLEPHQDSCVIDESETYGIFVWMPLIDTDNINGSLYVLPRSHLWGNYLRSQHIPWAFRKLHKKLWKHSIPVHVNKGDIVFFDTALIHSSEVNRSNEFRVAMDGALLPKNTKLVEFLLEDDNMGCKYEIDSDYWLDGGKVSSLNKYKHSKQPYGFPNPIKYKNVISLIEHYK